MLDLKERSATARHDETNEAGKVGARTLAAGLPVQRRASAGGGGGGGASETGTSAPADDPFGLHVLAEQGVSGSGGALPHGEAIQRSFGPGHDLSGIEAHTDGAARAATGAMGADGYAAGHHVAFAGSPSLHLAAHEAAHVVQQRAGVQLAGGVGEVGDVYERNADAVADRVVAGESAADLLPAPGAGGAGAVQHKKQAAPEADEDVEDDAELDGDEALEVDESEEEATQSVNLAEGKPPGNVQMRRGATPRATAARRAPALTIGQAVRKYAPLVWIAPGEEYGPSDASEFIRNSRLRWSHDSGRGDHQLADQGEVNERALGDGGYSHQTQGIIGGHGGEHHDSNDDVRPQDDRGDGGNEGMFLDLDNDARKRLGQNRNAPVYHEAVNRRFITYWFFYAYNPGPTSTGLDNHEGDWERIVVKLDRRNRATRVAYYQHDGGPKQKAWKDVQKSGTHPIVFSGKGSHASFFEAGKHPGFAGIPDVAGKGRQWRTWNNLKNVRAQGWYGYGGGWGEVGSSGHLPTTGPQGPSAHKPPGPSGW